MRHARSYCLSPRYRRALLGEALAWGMVLAAIVSPPFAAIAAPQDPPATAAPPWPPAIDLAADGTEARRSRKPIVLYFERRDCPYCRRAAPYLAEIAKTYAERALFRRIEADRADLAARDFAGAPTHHAALARQFKGTLTPTVLVVGPEAQPLAAPLIGLPDESFYSHYLTSLIEAGIAKLAHTTPPALGKEGR